MNAKLVTFSQHPELYEVAAAMINLPYPKVVFDSWSPRYIIDTLEIEADWLIHFDADTFVFDPNRIQRLMEFMDAEKIACCGMPDGGVVDIRFHNPVACNPFFNIINRKLVLESKERDPGIVGTPWQEHYRRHTPLFVRGKGRKFSYDYFEPFYGLYFWFCKHGFKILYLDAETWKGEPEQYSTLLKDHTGVFFLLHTWYSREYHGAHRNRINRAIGYAQELRKENQSSGLFARRDLREGL